MRRGAGWNGLGGIAQSLGDEGAERRPLIEDGWHLRARVFKGRGRPKMWSEGKKERGVWREWTSIYRHGD